MAIFRFLGIVRDSKNSSVVKAHEPLNPLFLKNLKPISQNSIFILSRTCRYWLIRSSLKSQLL